MRSTLDAIHEPRSQLGEQLERPLPASWAEQIVLCRIEAQQVAGNANNLRFSRDVVDVLRNYLERLAEEVGMMILSLDGLTQAVASDAAIRRVRRAARSFRRPTRVKAMRRRATSSKFAGSTIGTCAAC